MKLKRILSMVIDLIFIILFEAIFYDLIGIRLFDSATVSVGVAYFLALTIFAFMQSKWDGQTIGKRIVKLKVEADDELEMSFLKYWVRYLIAYALTIVSAGIILLVNVIMIIIRKDQKTVHDLIVHTHIEKMNLAV